MNKNNTVVSGRYFAGIWKCFLYPIPIILLFIIILSIFYPTNGIGSWWMGVLIGVIILTILLTELSAMWFLHADAVNLKKTHGLDKRAWPYWIAFIFSPSWSVITYHWTRSGLIQKAGFTPELLTWEDRLLPYKNKNNIPTHKRESVNDDH
tara:strand:- start:122 stop:574 length:453 start_codon:yes stop_codon:yes gene_type:complete